MKQVYGNDFGLAFYWKRTDDLHCNKIQLVFKETGFHLTLSELEYFSTLICESQSRIEGCADCELRGNCSRFLLQTPANQIDLAVSVQELNGIQDLVDGTIFKLKLLNYLSGVGQN